MKTKIFYLVLAIVASFAFSSFAQDDTKTINIFRTSFDNEKDLYDGFPSPEQAEGKVNVKVENGYYRIKGINADRNHLIMEFPQYNQSDLVSFKIEADISWESGDEFQPFGICVVDANGVAYRFALNRKGYSKVHTSNENEPGDVEMISNRILGSYSSYYFKIEINNNGLYGYLNDNYWAAIVGSIAHPIKYAGYFTKGFTVVSSGSFSIDKTVKLPPKTKAHYHGIGVVALNEDNSQLISVGNNGNGVDYGFALWNTESGAELKRGETVGSSWGSNLSFSPDLKYCYYALSEGDKGRSINLKSVDAPDLAFRKIYGNLKKDNRSSDGFIASGFLDNKYFVYQEMKANIIHYIDLATGTPFKSVKIKDKTLKLVDAIDISKVFFENETTVMCYDLDAQKVLYEISYDKWGTWLLLTKDKKYLFQVCTYKEKGFIKWINVTDGTLVKEFKNADQPLLANYSFSISDDNKYLIGKTMDELIFVVDLENCEVIKSYPCKGVSSYAVSKDMQYIYIGFGNGELHQIDVITGETVKVFGSILVK